VILEKRAIFKSTQTKLKSLGECFSSALEIWRGQARCNIFYLLSRVVELCNSKKMLIGH